jgi:hypothetical protein
MRHTATQFGETDAQAGDVRARERRVELGRARRKALTDFHGRQGHKCAGNSLWILGRMVYAAYSRFSKQAMGTLQLASTAKKAMSSLGGTLALWPAAIKWDSVCDHNGGMAGQAVERVVGIGHAAAQI